MSDFVATLDAASERLLKTVGLAGTLPEGEKIVATPAEQVKAFEAVMDWAKNRSALVPKDKVESPFDAIKRGFNGETPERRGRRAKAKTDGSPDDGEKPGLFDA
jgi:hypothetical protein